MTIHICLWKRRREANSLLADTDPQGLLDPKLLYPAFPQNAGPVVVQFKESCFELVKRDASLGRSSVGNVFSTSLWDLYQTAVKLTISHSTNIFILKHHAEPRN